MPAELNIADGVPSGSAPNRPRPIAIWLLLLLCTALATISVAAVVSGVVAIRSAHGGHFRSKAIAGTLVRGVAGSFLILVTVAIYERRRIGKYLGSVPLVSLTTLLLVDRWPGPAIFLEAIGYWTVQIAFATLLLYWAYAAAWSEKARLYYEG